MVCNLKVLPTKHANLKFQDLIDDFWTVNAQKLQNYFNNSDFEYFKYYIIDTLRIDYTGFDKYNNDDIRDRNSNSNSIPFIEGHSDSILIYSIDSNVYSEMYPAIEYYQELADFVDRKDYYIEKSFRATKADYYIGFKSRGSILKSEAMMLFAFVVAKKLDAIIHANINGYTDVFKFKTFTSESFLSLFIKSIGFSPK